MRQQGCWRRGVSACLLAAALIAAPGCLSFVHPIDPAIPELADPCRMLPKCARDHVYILFVHGMDPADCANLSGVRDYVQALMDHREGRIGPTVVTAQQNLRTAGTTTSAAGRFRIG